MLAHQSVHRYPPAVMWWGILRAGAGCLAALVVWIASGENPVVSVICITIFLICLAYGVRTALRGMSELVLDDTGLRVAGPWRRAIAWKDLTGMRLGYYTTRRDGENGWMELSLRGRSGRITLDSDIDGFGEIARRCLEAAQAGGLELSPATLRNFDAALADPAGHGELQARRSGEWRGE